MERISRKVKKYEKLIIDLLYAYKDNQDDIYVIIDHKSRHYQALMAGWDSKQKYWCRVEIHFHIRTDGIICLFENHTEVEVVDILMEQRVPKSDILMKFLPQSAREYAGYAVV
jgi:XisI protein